jgi:hypothetical protein
MNDDDYRIEKLGDLFAEHAIKAEKQHEEDIRKFKENYPDSELPEHFQKPYFSIARALSVMAYEIAKLSGLANPPNL